MVLRMPRTSTPPPAVTHYIVDGSNIATEGRALPSLQQLNDAVMAFIEEHPDALITVVVDATFGHRIDKKEVRAFDEAVANNELVTPPAGAVGRGDAFVLSIANKANAGILSNDSFQEFHGDYDWLFDEGRLIGGKPVPHVGWVFVERLPVRGPKSRQSVKEAKGQQTKTAAGERRSRAASSAPALTSQPLPVPSKPPPGPAAAGKSRRPAADTAAVVAASAAAAVASPAAKTAVNDLLPFLDFVERHPVGTGCTVVVESYASHGAYARAGDVLVYLPLRLMGDPMPRSARAAVAIGEAIAVVIVGYVPERRSIDAALVSAGEVAVREAAVPAPVEAAPTDSRRRRKPRPAPDAVADTATEPTPAADVEVAEAAPKRRSRAAKKVAEAPSPEPVPETPAPAKRAAKRSSATPTKAATKAVAKTAAKPAAKRASKRVAVQPDDQPPAPAKKRAAKTAPPPQPVEAATPKKRTRATKSTAAKAGRS